MGRPYAKLYRDIWADGDFASLGPESRYVYMFLFSQPDLNAAGVLPLTMRRWAASAGVMPAAIEAAIACLDERKYVVTDTGTEELLIRTYIRNDELWRIPNTLYAVVRDAVRTVSPTLRATLAAELGALPVDELTGKRAEVMKAQVIRVTATLNATVGPTVGLTNRVRVRVRDAGAGGSLGVPGSVDDQSSAGHARAREGLIDLIQQEIQKATGKDITEEWAAGVRDLLLKGRPVSDPVAYLRQAIRGEPNPAVRFLPANQPPAYQPPNGQGRVASEDVSALLGEARQAMRKDPP